jgi:hypothetical protein
MEPHNRRLSWRLAVVFCAALFVAVLGSVTPASATVALGCTKDDDHGTRTCSFQNDRRTETVEVTIDVDAGFVGIVTTPNASFNTAAGATVYVAQCDGLGHNCSTIATSNGKSFTVETSRKPGPLNHTFHACASWTTTTGWHEVNRCSPFWAT